MDGNELDLWGEDAGRPAPARRVSVLLPLPLGRPLDYRLPDGESAEPGTIVLAPVHGRMLHGVVWDSEPDPGFPLSRLKTASVVPGLPRLAPDLRRLIDWVAGYTLSAPGEVLAMAIRSPLLAPLPDRTVTLWGAGPSMPEGAQLTPARKRVLEILAEHETLSLPDLVREAGIGAGVIRSMAERGWLTATEGAKAPAFAQPDPAYQGAAVLSGDQRAAADALAASVTERAFSVTLLDGVTGSGKTETYLEAVAEAIRLGRQSLILLPEIALSAQWLERFARRFGVPPAVWHSDLSPATRRRTWRAVADGTAMVVVGARSALFLPFADLGLIIVDEEHESAFKQEEGVIYHARDMAVVRARIEALPIALVSATPSLETLANVEAGRYRRLSLASRHGGASLPEVTAIDLRSTPPERGRFIAPPMIQAITDTLERGEQAMLFLNRRGYAPLTLCRHCGHRFACPHCTAWLVEHRQRRILQCHHCGHSEGMPEACPACDATDSLTPVGPGVERVTEEIELLFPDARRLVMASDTIGGPEGAARAARQITDRAVDLIIGTQIVAKGWHFPHLTLVGVIDADLGLAGGDLRAGERTLQLLHQVAGRAGRAEAPGRVLLQSYAPEHPVIQALISGDIAAFMEAEAEGRRPGHWPPFGRLAALIVSGEDMVETDRVSAELGRRAPHAPGVEVLGPAPAPLAMLRGRHRRRLLLRTRKDIAVQPILKNWLSEVSISRNVRVDIDVDPVSFL
ncbi:primosomal protein N' [Acidisoma cellulosilytica]|uniref:Replication restart protein PriA n=1 Tax=Acidisoma cellulosilyticum TaxID=2802395 RepID=A0A963Z0B3_9PROT|nr:primosomal protein N' [Acidisoma cellulosilyticum]MCB8880356.1 primosomal protein N' [Acidisoma cellulosilyticum]